MSDEPIKSTEKVQALLAELPQRLAGVEDERLQAAAGFWPMLKPYVLPMLPDDPAQLDKVLEELAMWALRARSDDARGFVMRTDAGDVQARWLDDLQAAPAAPAAAAAVEQAAAVEPEPTPVPIETAPADFADVPTEPMGPTTPAADDAQ